MGRLEKQIIAGALALVGILLSVVVYRGVERRDPALTILDGERNSEIVVSEWKDPADSTIPDDDSSLNVVEPTAEREPLGALEVLAAQDVEIEKDESSTTRSEPLIPTSAVSASDEPVEFVEARALVLDSSDSWDTELTVYTIQPRDSLSQIALRELGSSKFVDQILVLNEGLNPKLLQVGQSLLLPSRASLKVDVPVPTLPVAVQGSAATHTVAKGDSLWRIVKKYGIEGGVLALVEANDQLVDAEVALQIGWVLSIPE
ncbi:MAG: LysM peptidoglycan-binding domain-containing protein [Planctomycetes bacterium]|nr:LysM peptidoglycan-binding domain-containing protein [Planctomycetota bacterium]